MSASRNVSIAAAVALVGIIAVVASDDGVVAEVPANAKVAWRKDGTRVYVVPVLMKDGTVVEKETEEAPCKRRPKDVDGKLCQRVQLDIQGKPRTDPAPVLGRFPAETMLGDGCEPVACAVMAGEDAEATEEPRKGLK